jgi:hypothetical protein
MKPADVATHWAASLPGLWHCDVIMRYPVKHIERLCARLMVSLSAPIDLILSGDHPYRQGPEPGGMLYFSPLCARRRISPTQLVSVLSRGLISAAVRPAWGKMVVLAQPDGNIAVGPRRRSTMMSGSAARDATPGVWF